MLPLLDLLQHCSHCCCVHKPVFHINRNVSLQLLFLLKKGLLGVVFCKRRLMVLAVHSMSCHCSAADSALV